MQNDSRIQRKKGIITVLFFLIFIIGSVFADRHAVVLNNGEEQTTEYVYFWDTLKPGIPEKENFEFLGWQDKNGHIVNRISAIIEHTEYTAVYAPNIYSISYYDNETLLTKRGYLYGENNPLQYLITNESSHPYETFQYWETEDGKEINVIDSSYSKDISVYAKYTGKTYSIDYHTNGGSLSKTQDTYTYGIQKELPSPQKSGYIFTGWYSDESLTTPIDFISNTTHGNLVLYAGYEKIITRQTISQWYNPSPQPSPSSNTNVSSTPQPVNDGALGTISIGSYSARLFQGGSSNAVNQPIVDAPNSAVLMNYLGRQMIADHADQGFSIIRSCTAGSVGSLCGRTIVCASTYQGTNTGNGIKLSNGRWADEVYDGTYIMYTCNDSSGVSVTVTFWN